MKAALTTKGDNGGYMTKEQVKQLLGPPDRTEEIGNASYWYYRERTIDPDTGKVDRELQLRFGGGNGGIWFKEASFR